MTGKQKDANLEEWMAGRLRPEEIQALPEALRLVEVCRVRGISRTVAYTELKRNVSSDGSESVLFGQAIWKERGKWWGSKTDTLARLRRGGRGAVA